ncbi:MAG: transcriptional regulator, partial [Fervidobacterium sp.]
ETQISGGRVDLLVNVGGKEYLIEVKSNIWYDEYEKGKRQIVEYVKRRGLKEGWYVIFEQEVENRYEKEEIEGIILHIWWIKTKYGKPSKINT